MSPNRSSSAAPQAERLPRGRHGLSRQEVVASQRERLFRAMAGVTARKGYAATSVADVLREAGISRETFYQQFASKEDCVMQAFQAAVEGIAASVAAAAPGGLEDPFARLERALGDYLNALAAEPELARMLLVEIYAVGPAALGRRAEQQRAIAAAIAGALGATEVDARFACEAFVAATASLVTTRLATGDADGVRALHDPLVKLARRLLSRD